MLQAALDLSGFVFINELFSYFFKRINGKIKTKVAVEILYGKVETGLILVQGERVDVSLLEAFVEDLYAQPCVINEGSVPVPDDMAVFF